MPFDQRGQWAPGPVSPLDRSSPLPLWAQLRDRLGRRLNSGEFAEHFPAELELAKVYGVSRQTVREALRELRRDGRVVAGRGRRNRVADAAPIEAPVGALYSLFRAVAAAGHKSRSVVRALELRHDPAAAGRLEVSAGTPLVYLERLRLSDDEPLAFDRLWMPAEVAAPLLQVDFTDAAFYDELAQHCGLHLQQGGERIHAEVASAAQRRVLQLGPRTAVFRIERLATWLARPAEWRVTLVRGDRFSLSAEWSAESDYQLQPAPATARPAG